MGRPITVTVGPLAAASANKIALQQKAANSATNYLVLNGAAGSFSANAICLSQTPGGAVALTLNGALASSAPTGVAIAYLGAMQRIYITSAANDSGRTFTVVGTGFGPNGVYAVSETITGANTSTVSSLNTYYTITSITVDAGTAGAITVGQYGTATLDVARQVLFTDGGNDAAVKFTISGTDVNGQPQSETLTGTNGATVGTALSYLTVTSISSNAAVATNITVGTNGVAASMPMRTDDYAGNAQVALQVNVTGTANYTVQSSMDDPNDFTRNITPSQMVWVNTADTNLVNATTTQQSNFAAAPVFIRLLLNSGNGTCVFTARQIVER